MPTFQHELIKGRIAETIFEEMFRETGCYTILRFGYEMTHAMLAQYQYLAKRKDVLDQVRRNPDFVLISNDKTQIYFIEVKYRAMIKPQEVLTIARDLEVRWGISHVFIISHKGFFYGNVHELIKNEGIINKLSTKLVSQECQDKYLKFVDEFLP